MSLKELNRKDLNDRIFHWPDIHEFCDTEAQKRVFYETPNTVGAVWSMKPGQELPMHSHEKADDIWIVLQGTAEYYPKEGCKVQIQAGDVIVARPKECHGMINNSKEDFIMLGIAGPTPIGYVPREH